MRWFCKHRSNIGKDVDECSGKKNDKEKWYRYLKATQVVCESSDQDERPEEKQVYINYYTVRKTME